MYFLKFAKWFWLTYLSNTEERVFFVLLLWVTMSILFGAISFMLNSIVIMIYFLYGSGVFLIAGFLFLEFLYLRRRYLEWQNQVFKKLKNDKIE